MKLKRPIAISAVVLAVVVALVLAAVLRCSPRADHAPLRVAVPPFVDTAFIIVGDQLGFFHDESIELSLVSTSWENQYELMAGGQLDVAMSTLDEFVNKDKNLRLTGNRVFYFLPAWQFRGLAFYASKIMRPFSDFTGNPQYSTLRDAKDAFLGQLRGKKIVYPEGSVFEQAFRAFTADTGFPSSSLSIVNAPLDAALNSLSDTSVGIVAVGSQQRFEAQRRGYSEAISPESLGLDILTGFIVREKILESRRPEVLAFIRAWYRTAKFVSDEQGNAYKITNKYLIDRGANSLTYDEYQALRAYNVLPTTPSVAADLFFSPKGSAYWKNIWDRSVAALHDARRGNEAPPDLEGFLAPALNSLLLQETPK